MIVANIKKLGSPSAPLGATVSNVTNTSVVLSWLPSESDGGRDFSEIFYFVYIMGNFHLSSVEYCRVEMLFF